MKSAQPFVSLESAVRKSEAQTKEYFQIWKESNSRKEWMKARGCNQSKACLGENLSKDLAAILLYVSRQNARILMNYITRLTSSKSRALNNLEKIERIEPET